MGVVKPLAVVTFDIAFRRRAVRQNHLVRFKFEMEILNLVECFRLHMTLRSLSQAVLKGYKERDVAKLLGIAERLDEQIHCASREEGSDRADRR